MGHAKTPPAFRAMAMTATLGLLGACMAGGCPAADDLVVLANRDDDDHDGRPDADDERVNGADDERDLATLDIPVPPGARSLRLAAGDAPLRFFVRDADGWRHVGLGGGTIPVPAATAGRSAATVGVGVEATAWAGLPPAWNGEAVVEVTGDGPPADAVTRPMAIRVAPVRLLPATASVDEVYVSTERYDNRGFLAEFRPLLDGLTVPLREHPTKEWREMWMQDTMEVAIAATDRSSMSVVLAGLRGADTFPPTLLGPDVAVAEVARPRPLEGGDSWADWYGNLEVSIPTAAWPLGRVIHGRNLLTGCSFHPDLVTFLAAQRAQPPVWIDTSWLMIKHVDEIVSFLPGADGRGAILVPDPEAGLAMLDGEPADAAVRDRRREVARRIARRIDQMLDGDADPPRAGESAAAARVEGDAAAPGLLALLGLARDRVVRLPVAFDVPEAGLLPDGTLTDATSLWSNPVNALVVNGTVICGGSGMPEAVREACREHFLAAGAERVAFVDDGCYQKNLGNVHCATNTRRRDAAAAPAEPTRADRP